MKKRLFSTLIIVFTLSCLTIPGSVQARMKCWTNSDGVKECGNTVPPEYAQQSHQEIGKGGMVREETERAKTDEELAEARLKAIEAKQAEKQEEQDQILLQTFSEVSDIERARDERITALESAIQLTRTRKCKDTHRS